MRILIFLCSFWALTFSSQAQTKTSTSKTSTKKTSNNSGIPAALRFKDSFYEFGVIKQGEVVNHEFEFTNMGKKPLVISNATVTCGCTTPSYPFVPIGPGETGTIGINFNSRNKLGNQTPTVTVISNLGTFKLQMKGIVSD